VYVSDGGGDRVGANVGHPIATNGDFVAYGSYSLP